MPRRLRRSVAATVAAALSALIFTGCATSYDEGPAGQVADKREHLHCRNTSTSSKKRQQVCNWRYWLTTHDRSGDHEFRVGGSVYRHCVRGATYPTCTKKGS